MNEILSSKRHDTFFNRDCRYGMSSRVDSDGTIEASWYLPSESDRDGFEVMFTILNLRGESMKFPKQFKWLCSASDLVFVMLDLRTLSTEQYLDFVESSKLSDAHFVVCFVAVTFEQIDQCSDGLEKCQTCFTNSKIKIFDVLYNWSYDLGRLLSIDEWKTDVHVVIRKYLGSHEAKKTLIELEKVACEMGFRTDERHPLCKETFGSTKCNLVFQTTTEMTNFIGGIDPVKRKLEVLPLQGELWLLWGQLKKEQYRSKLAPDKSIDKFIAEKESQELDVRKKQFEILKNKLSPLLIEIDSKLIRTNNAFAIQYFVNCLQLIFNKWSNAVIPFLRNKYYTTLKENRRKWSKSLDEDSKCRLKNENMMLSEGINNASFGIEHIFREFGQMYETITSLPSNIEIPEKLCMISNYPHIVARMILHGLPFEIMDGDTGFIPITWVEAVLQEIKNIEKDKRLFIVSVMGIQSSGKSTLLNTMFGLKFPVSAGRCTKGVYFVMIPVDKVSMGVDYDYLMVIDTEGLRALETQGVGWIHDNELATLVVGLGDVTIVNIKGENSADLNDVLQIVIHAMIRIRLANPNLVKPSCFFVHQNVPSIEADDKLKIAQEKLLEKLDKITVEAAEEEKVAHIERFQDVISYDEHKHVFYMPDLWQGQPPMAPMNCGYSDRVKQIKKMLTCNIASKSRLSTINSFKNRITNLWNAILNEDFVFSFKNSEEAQAYSRLDQKFTKLYWEFKDLSLKWQEYFQSGVLSAEEKGELQKSEITLEQKIKETLTDLCTKLQTDLAAYFDESEHRDILAKWREIEKIKMDNLCCNEKNRIIRVLHENVNNRIKQLDTHINLKEQITKTAMKTALDLRRSNKELKDEHLREYFNQQWPEWLKIDTAKDNNNCPENEICLEFLDELQNVFSSHCNFLQDELKENPLNKRENHNFRQHSVSVQAMDLEYKSSQQTGHKSKVSNYAASHGKSENMVTSAETLCTKITEEIQHYVESWYGTDFHPGQVAQVLQICDDFFRERDAKTCLTGYVFSIKFRIRFTIDVCKCSVNELIKNKIHFMDVNSPSAEVIKRKNDFFRLFKNTYQHISNEIIAADWFKTEMRNLIFSAVATKMGRLIFNAVLTDESSCFDTKQQFLNRIHIDIGESRDFSEYLDYRSYQLIFFIRKIRDYILTIMNNCDLKTNKTKLAQLIDDELQMYLMKVKNALEELQHVKHFNDMHDYLMNLKLKIETKIHKQPFNTDLSYLANTSLIVEQMDITDFERFTQLLIDQILFLQGNLNWSHFVAENDNEVSSEELYSQLHFPSGTDPVDLLVEKVLGCRQRCPFCNIPCKYTCKDHAGDHSALQHCPLGVLGSHDNKTQKLNTWNCQSAIASDLPFISLVTEGLPVPFKEYRKYFPDWIISPDRRMETSLYWKWFMYTFHDDLVEHFKVKPADIPNEWKEITWEDAKQSLMKDN